MSTKINSSIWWLILGVGIVMLAAWLRWWHLSSTPPSPYWEEVALGYDAFSLLETGNDHHGHAWPVVAFESFGDWKPAGYYYALLPFIATMGLSVTSVRLPAVIAGVLIVIGVGWLSRLLGQWWKLNEGEVKRWQLITMLVTAVSPWAIVFSRAAWEVNLATCLVVWGIGCGWSAWLQARNHRSSWRDSVWMASAALLLVLSMYTYHAARVIAPVLGLGLGLTWVGLTWPHQRWGVALKKWAVAIIPAFLLALPLVLALGSPVTSQRFAETSIFSDVSVIERSNELQALAGHSWWSRLLYHRYVLFGRVILLNFFAHFTPQFLFLSGDTNPRHSIQFLGQLYPFEILFLGIGAIWVIWKYRLKAWFLWLWLVIGIVPAAITLAAPHALRTLFVMPLMMLVVGTGIVRGVEWGLRHCKRWLSPVVAERLLWTKILVVYALGILIFWRFYTGVYAQLYSAEWQGGYEEMVQHVSEYRSQHPEVPVYITREQGRPAMYYWFFTKTDPRLVQAANGTAKQDQGEFLEFENMKFIRSVDEVTTPGLVVSSPEQANRLQSRFTTQLVFTVSDGQRGPVWAGVAVE